MKEYATTDGAALPAADEFLSLALDLIEPSPTNPRKHFNTTDLAELAESIKASGVHQPVLVRPLPGSRVADTAYLPHRAHRPTHELVAGERRLRAAKLAGVATIPALVRDLTDAQVLEIQLVENLQRQDLTELEEAEGYQLLMDGAGINAEAVGAKIGKSRSYVFARLKLLELCFEARASLRDGAIDASRALLVARIPDHKLQIRAMQEIVSGSPRYYGNSSGREPMTYREAAGHVRNTYMLKLNTAVFDIARADLVDGAGACQACPKRTGANPDLFADVNNADVCTDPPCFHKKGEAHTAAMVDGARQSGHTIICAAEAKDLLTSNYHAKFKGYKRLDVAEDSPTEIPLRKLIGKQMKAEGITPVMIENPNKKGDLIAALPNEMVLRLLKTVEGQAQAVKAVSKEVAALIKDKKAAADAKATEKYEQDWRNQLLACVWVVLSANPTPEITIEVHRYLALRAVSGLSTDDAAALCKLLGLGKVAMGSALRDHVKTAPNPDQLHLLILMQRDSSANDCGYGDYIANEALMLVAGMVLKDQLPNVMQELKTASLARFFPKPEAKNPPGTNASAAQAVGAGGKDKPKGPKTSAPLRKPKLSPIEAQAAIAAAMQAQDTNSGADAQGIETGSGFALPVQPATPAKLQKFAVGQRVTVITDTAQLNAFEAARAGKSGTLSGVREGAFYEGLIGQPVWNVTFKGRNGGMGLFPESHLVAEAAP